MRRPVNRCNSFVLSTTKCRTRGRCMFRAFSNFARLSACAMVLGNPSRTNPFAQSGRAMRSSTMPITIASGTKPPRSITGLACIPSGVPRPTWSRNMSPVERCGTPKRRAISFDWVPLPAPGGPTKITARPSVAAGPTAAGLRVAAATHPPLFRKAFVMPHHELRFNLLNRVHRHTDHQPLRKQADQREIHAAHERQPAENPVDVLGGVPPRPDAGNEPAVLAHVVREFGGIEHDSHIEKREQNDHRNVDDGIQR